MDYQQIKKGKYYKLRRQWKELKQEHNELEFVFDKISIQFVKSVRIFCSENDLGDPFQENDESTQKVGGYELTSSSKAFFRKIMVSTHPDKQKKIENAKGVYDQAAKAKKEGNLQELLDAGRGISLTLDLEKITTDELSILEGNINELKDKMKKIKNSYAWVWFHANPRKRNEIFYDFIESHAQ